MFTLLVVPTVANSCLPFRLRGYQDDFILHPNILQFGSQTLTVLGAGPMIETNVSIALYVDTEGILTRQEFRGHLSGSGTRQELQGGRALSAAEMRHTPVSNQMLSFSPAFSFFGHLPTVVFLVCTYHLIHHHNDHHHHHSSLSSSKERSDQPIRSVGTEPNTQKRPSWDCGQTLVQS